MAKASQTYTKACQIDCKNNKLCVPQDYNSTLVLLSFCITVADAAFCYSTMVYLKKIQHFIILNEPTLSKVLPLVSTHVDTRSHRTAIYYNPYFTIRMHDFIYLQNFLQKNAYFRQVLILT